MIDNIRLQHFRSYTDEAFEFGRLDARCGNAGLRYVEAATRMCLGGEADAMVTAPLNKEALAAADAYFAVSNNVRERLRILLALMKGRHPIPAGD